MVNFCKHCWGPRCGLCYLQHVSVFGCVVHMCCQTDEDVWWFACVFSTLSSLFKAVRNELVSHTPYSLCLIQYEPWKPDIYNIIPNKNIYCTNSMSHGRASPEFTQAENSGSTATISEPLRTWGVLDTGYTARVDAYDTGFTLEPEMGFAPRHTPVHTDLLRHFQPWTVLRVGVPWN